MDEITMRHKNHHAKVFDKYGETAKGVDWGDEHEFLFRQAKMLDVVANDELYQVRSPSLLDVGCGWGALYEYIESKGMDVDYTGMDVVESLVRSANKRCQKGRVFCGDVLEIEGQGLYDYVVCNGVLTQKLSDTMIPEMEEFSRKIIWKMFSICRRGIAFNMMSTRVNYMDNNLYYQNPGDLLSWLLSDVSPRVLLNHSYSSLGRGEGRLYDFTVYVYKD